MFENSKVIWWEGSFFRHQHLQQHDRYLEKFINGRCLGLQPYDWGFYTLTIDSDLFKIGKLAIKECKGIFPDGTPFNMPEDEELPLPIDIPENIHDEVIFLCLPLKRQEFVEIDSSSSPEGLARFRMSEREVKDNTSGAGGKFPVQIGKLKTQLMRQEDERSGYSSLGVVRVVEVRADKNIIVDDTFIPPNLNCFSVPRLRDFLIEMHGLLNIRGKTLASQVATPGQGGVSEIIDFLLLQLMNRYQPLFEHLTNVIGLHPEDVYRVGTQLAGELATFFRPDKRPVNFPVYNHEDLQATFSPLMEELRELLAKVHEPMAVQIPLKGPKYGIYAAQTPDLGLLENCIFVLAAKTDVPPDTLRRDFPSQIIVGPVEEINQLVRALRPGIAIHPLAVVPRQIPYHAGFTYFELDKHHEDWKKMRSSGGFGFHISGNFPGLLLEFWAIKEG